MGLYMFHDFIISWSTMYPIILYFYGLLYSPFYIQIMDYIEDHNFYFSWTYIQTHDIDKSWISISIHDFY